MSTPPLDFDPSTVSLPQGHFIGGAYYLTDEEQIAVYRPSDGQLLGYIPDASADTIDYAVSNALHAWKTSGWATRPPRERAKVLTRWAELIDRNAVSLAQIGGSQFDAPGSRGIRVRRSVYCGSDPLLR